MKDSLLDEVVMNIVNHLNYGLELPLSGDQKLEILRLNYQAGIKAKEAQALLSAIIYFRNGVNFASTRMLGNSLFCHLSST